MIHTYKIEGMTCSGCVAKVKASLLALPDVMSAEVSLEKNEAVIAMQKHIPASVLRSAIGKYRIMEEPGAMDDQKAKDPAAAGAYRPLFIVFAFIFLVSALTSFHDRELHLMMFMDHFMAGFFLVFSFFKMLDLRGFATSFSMYDIIARRFYAYGYVYPFIELGLGIAYLMNADPLLTNTANLAVMIIGTIGVVQSVVQKRKIQCACLGTVFNLPMSTVTIIENSIMIVMAVIMLLVF